MDKTLAGSYVSVQDFSQAATGIDPSILQPGELARTIRRASAWVNRYCRQTLYATQSTETLLINGYPNGFVIDRNTGTLKLFPKNFPIRQVVSVKTRGGISAASLVIYDSTTTPVLGATDIHNRFLTVAGEQRFNVPASGDMVCDLLYVNGWAVSSISAAATAGSTTATFYPQPGQATVQGFLPSVTVELQDQNPETLTVLSTTGNVVTFTTPFVNNHGMDTMAAELEFSTAQQATLLVVSYLIKTRGMGPLTLKDERVAAGTKLPEAELLMDAKDLLVDYQAGQ